jgi:RAMP superfamily
MSRHALSRPAGGIRRRSPRPHDRWDPGLLTGTLWLRLETLAGQYVSPGTGRLALTTSAGGEEIVAQEAARAAGTPVLPGSGIKGAVRTLFEMLSFSCDPLSWQDRCRPDSCCDACAVFGLMSYSGNLSFGDATPAGAVRVEVQKIPMPWKPDPEKTPGQFRLYDLREATFLGKGRKTPEPQEKVLAREVFTGTFESRVSFSNLTAEEMGRVLLAMGLAPDLSMRFPLRLGGVKYDGKGAVEVRPRKLALGAGERTVVEDEACRAECARWIAAARSSPWASEFGTKLDELAGILGAGR